MIDLDLAFIEKMSKMFYDAEGYAASVKDERYARRIVINADGEARRYVNLNKEVQEKNDQGLYEQLNDSRRTVAAEHARLIAELSELPLASHGLVLESAERLRRLLEEFPDVSDPQADNARRKNPDGGIQGSVTDCDERKRNYSFRPFVHEEMVNTAHGQEKRLSFSGTIEFSRRISAPRENAALVAATQKMNTAPPDDADFGPGVERKRIRKKPTPLLVAPSLGVKESGAVVGPDMSLAEQQRIVVLDECDGPLGTVRHLNTTPHPPPPHRTEFREERRETAGKTGTAGIAPNVGRFVLPRPTDNRPGPDLCAPSAPPPPPFHPSLNSMVSDGNSLIPFNSVVRNTIETDVNRPAGRTCVGSAAAAACVRACVFDGQQPHGSSIPRLELCAARLVAVWCDIFS